MKYEETGGKHPKVSVNVLEQTDTRVIVSHLLYKHRVGLLSTAVAVLLMVTIYDRVIKTFVEGV